MIDYSIKITGFDKVLKRLTQYEGKYDALIRRAVAKTAMLGKGMIADFITDINLVDTGFYRSNWIPSMVDPYTWKLATNTEYAMVLEFGFHGQVTVRTHTRTSPKGNAYTVSEHLRQMNRDGYGAAQDTSVKMRAKLLEELQKALKEASR